MQDNKYKDASKCRRIDLKDSMDFRLNLAGFYDPIVKKHEDNVRNRFFT